MNEDELITLEELESRMGLLDEENVDPFQVFQSPRSCTDYEIHLSENIENNFAYVKLLRLLRSASKNDTVTMYLANYGGQCSTGFQIVNAIKDCACGVDIVLDAPSYSMGAIIAISGKSLKMNPGTFLLFHNYSGGDYGKGKEKLDATMHYYDHFHRHLKTVCSPFLTAAELEMLKHDKDVYVSCDDKDVTKRIKRHFKQEK